MTSFRVRAVLRMLSLLAGLHAASAQSSPAAALLAVNRQISLEATGNLLNYKEVIDGPGERESGWTPGFQAKGEALFDLARIRNIYASAQFNYANGTVGYYGHLQNTRTRAIRPFDSNSSLTTETIRVELGKGFL